MSEFEPDSITEDEWRVFQRTLCAMAFAPDAKAMSNRSAAVMRKNGILPLSSINSMTDDIRAIVLDPSHNHRMRDFGGPYLAYRASDEVRGLIGLSTILFQPEPEMRRAGLDELSRRYERNRGGFALLSEASFLRIQGLKAKAVATDDAMAMDACLKIVDLMEQDFFYRTSELRQTLVMADDDSLVMAAKNVLFLASGSIHFLKDLPVWNVARQGEVIAGLAADLIASSSSLVSFLNGFFRFFGHLPLSGRYSLGGLLPSWIDQSNYSGPIWDDLCVWTKEHGSPLATYHGLQFFAANPKWIAATKRIEYLDRVIRFCNGSKFSESLRRRDELTRHYRRHIETIELGADGDSASACAFWLAEYVATAIEGTGNKVSRKAFEVIDRQISAFAENWLISRPFVLPSTPRAAIELSQPVWTTALLNEVSNSEMLIRFDADQAFSDAIAKMASLRKVAPALVISTDLNWANDGNCNFLIARSVTAVDSSDYCVPSISSLNEFEDVLNRLSNFDSLLPAAKRILAGSLASLSISVPEKLGPLFEIVSDRDWRRSVFATTDDETANSVFVACCELAFRGTEHDWAHLLPHYLAVVCEDYSADTDTDPAIESRLIGFVVRSSVSFNVASAVDRLISSRHRNRYENHLAYWESRLLTVAKSEPRWVAAKCRGVLASLRFVANSYKSE